MKKSISSLFFVATLLIFSCNNQSNTPKIELSDTLEDQTEQMSEEQFYQVPSPDEFISLLKQSKAAYKANIVAPLTDYVLPEKQKMNLGVYAADMAYLATFGKFQETVKYFGKIKSMSDQLGMTNAIEKTAMERIEKNLTNIDSLTSITSNSFYNIMEQLKQNSDETTVGLIYIGGWIESMYIAFQLLNKFEQNHPIAQRIASQKLSLNNLILMLEANQNKDSAMQAWIDTLKNLLGILNSIEVNAEEVNNTDTSKVIVGTRNTYLINKETYDKLKTNIENLRTEIIKQ